MREWSWAFCAALLTCCGCSAAVEAPSASAVESVTPQVARLEFRLEGPTRITTGEALVVLPSIINHSPFPVTLVRHVGMNPMNCNYCYPVAYYELIDPTGEHFDIGTNYCDSEGGSVRESDFVQVPPGGTFFPFAGENRGRQFRILPRAGCGPGTRTIEFTYSTAWERAEKYLNRTGFRTQEDYADAVLRMQPLVDQVPKVELKSNVLQVQVVDPNQP